MAVRLGFLSTAKINGHVLDGARASSGVEVAAVASRDRARAEEYARRNEIPRAHGSYQELLTDPEVDLVYISLPNSMHVEWTLRSLEAGKHVLVEKPLTAHPEDVDRIWGLAEAGGLQVMEAFMWRHVPQTKRFAELVREGAIGKLQIVRSAFSFAMNDPAVNVRMRAELEGGSLMDVGCYCVSGIRLLAGEPLSVYGEQLLDGSGVDARFVGQMRMADEVRAQFYCSFETPIRKELEAVGSEGVLRISDPWHGWQPGIELTRPARGENNEGVSETELLEFDRADPYALELDDLANAIRGEGAPLLGREDAKGQARALEALYRSAREGRPVGLS
ncbi:MAG: Gfo/Idh/MocA family protein [Gaiellaceae bacterium]